METDLQELLQALYAEGQINDASEQDRSKKMLNLEPETAHLISILLRSTRRVNVLEIGTSSGYSTIWLAWAVRAQGGHVISVDRDARKLATADTNLRRAKLRELVDLVNGDATHLVADLPGPFDCVFFDADRWSAPAQLEILLPKLTPDILLLADNVHSHPEEIAGYLAAVKALPHFDHTVISVGKGLSLAYRAKNEVYT